MIVPENPDAPHVVVIRVLAESMEMMPTGELTGMPTKTAERVFSRKFANRGEAEAALPALIKDLSIHE